MIPVDLRMRLSSALERLHEYDQKTVARLADYLENPSFDTFTLKARDGVIVHNVYEQHFSVEGVAPKKQNGAAIR